MGNLTTPFAGKVSLPMARPLAFFSNPLGLGLVVLVLLVHLAGGCAGTTSNSVGSYGETAKSNYYKGLAELQDENYPEAIRYFTFVKNKFSFSKYAVLAERGIADTYYAEQKYIEAIDAFKMFIKFHPTHRDVVNGYAAYYVCQAYIKQLPGDWFLIPPSYEKDQGNTKEAVRELKIFLNTYPNSKYYKEVKSMYRESMKRLVDHELYVARFYLEREKPRAAIMRLQDVLERYKDAGVSAEALLLLGETYMQLSQKDKAKETFSTLIHDYPSSVSSAKAKLFLRHIASRRE